MKHTIKIGFFGGPEYSVIVLEKLRQAGFTISFVATSIDKPKGRKLALTPPPAKEWALKYNIPVIQATSLTSESFSETLKGFDCDVYVVMAFGRIIPEHILNIPKGKSLNIHPSLLPKFRGSCPIESAILADEKETGVTVMLMDAEMDHGPIVAHEKVVVDPWPPKAHDLGVLLVHKGADLLISILPNWIAGTITTQEQDHSKATYTKKITKEDGLIDFNDDPYLNFLKIRSYHIWPTAFFFADDASGTPKRIKITQASFKEGKLIIEKVIPEGKKEMDYKVFLTITR